ncbi:MAG: 50S ribosomal protein L20 [Rhodospirillaceae bacterium]|jgi:large subunit ribosomal protein L20|nr:50S ribosomal protein L20 [Rhodospirillaceae bacterium]MBL6941239.1 50S ribosomal protein L20 [Rhodospirillales bacterium]MBT4933174.1 50S ribosomal protein L20 [Rhodospirillaceae bacterium]MBT5563005.1 50S ribosomal protein L20 [Rhodospirillaceae bacterium]MBT6242659.1 50S ribosomal protein L20 [Rhodospirillaceae bacterium]
MARVKGGTTAHARHKKILDMASGYRDRGSSNFRVAIERVEKGLQYAYRDRRTKKRQFRRLWIQRINAGARQYGMTYSRFMSGLAKASIELDRKVLSELAISEPEAFKALVEEAEAALAKS